MRACRQRGVAALGRSHSGVGDEQEAKVQVLVLVLVLVFPGNVGLWWSQASASSEAGRCWAIPASAASEMTM